MTTGTTSSHCGQAHTPSETPQCSNSSLRFISPATMPRSRRPFLTATNGVAMKLRRAHEEAWPYPTEALLGSVAEELAMEAILVEAECQADLLLDSRTLSSSRQAELTEEIEVLREVSFKDRDFEFLFDAGKDGAVEDPGLQTQMGFLNLTFADWFSPFWEDDDLFGSA